MLNNKSPFKRKSHQRDGSSDGPFGFHMRSISGSSRHSGNQHSRSASNNGAPPVSGSSNTHRRTTSRSSMMSQSSNFLAEQYERDRKAIISYCFSKPDPATSLPPNNYITHVRIIEDAKYPSSRPQADSKLQNKKKRVLIISSKSSNDKVTQLHKARENSDGSFQIGRTWDMTDLVRIERDVEIDEGFTLTMGKRYYWETNSSKERTVFIKSLVNIYMQSSGGHVPELINWDLSLFYMDEKSYHRALIRRNQPPTPVASPTSASQPVSAGTRSGHMVTPPVVTPTNIYNASTPERTKSEYTNTISTTDTTLNTTASATTGSTQAKFLSRAPYPTSSSTINKVSRRYDNYQTPDTEHDYMNKNIYSSNEVSASGAQELGKEYQNISRDDLNPYPDVQTADIEVESNQNKIERELRTSMENPRLSPAKVYERVKGDEHPTTSSNPANSAQLLDDLNDLLSAEAKETENNSFNDNVIQSTNAEEAYEYYDQPLEGEPMMEETQPLQISKKPSESDDLDFNALVSDENQDDTNDMSFEKGDEARYSREILPPLIQEHTYHEVSIIQEEAPMIEKFNTREQSQELVIDNPAINNKNSKKTKAWDIDGEAMYEVLAEINWNAGDGADHLTQMLTDKLNHIKYGFNKDILSLQQYGTELNEYESNVAKECDRMNPIFSLFLMEINNVSEDINYIEGQNNGLQVESANKKMLWNTLTELLNTVSLDEETLNDLLNSPISERNLVKMESQLEALFNALKAIRGEENEEEYNLGEIKALSQRRQAYEKVTGVFLERVVQEMGKKFANIQTYDVTNDQLTSMLTRMLIYSSLTRFCKDVSPELYATIVETWDKSVQPFYEQRFQKMFSASREDGMSDMNSEQKSLVYGLDEDEFYRQWLEYKRIGMLPDYQSPSSKLLSQLLKYVDTLEKSCINYQNFVDNFFHISSDADFAEYISRYREPGSRMVSLEVINDVEPDRKVASLQTQFVSRVFQPTVLQLSKIFTDALKSDKSIAPALLLFFEQATRELGASNQEYLLSVITRINAQVKQSWLEYVDERVLYSERAITDFSEKSILPSLFGIPIFIRSCWSMLRCMQKELHIEDVSTYSTNDVIESAFSKLVGAAAVSLTRSSDGSTVALDTESQGGRTNSMDRTVTILVNSHWLLETLPVFNKDGVMDSALQQVKAVFDKEREIYANYILRASMPKLSSFVFGAASIMEASTADTINQSRWAVYSKQNLDNILAEYTSQEVGILVKRLHQEMVKQFADDRHEYLAQLLNDRMWSFIQGDTVSLYLKLYMLVDKHYKGTVIRFSKNDIIAAFDKLKS